MFTLNRLAGAWWLIVLWNVFTGMAQAQVKAFVKENTVQVKTIDPGSTDFSDLEALGNAIGDARIVMLGEQDHGDAPTFLAKTRIIQYLHEKKGFNILAFESDFFALNEGVDKLAPGTDTLRKFLKENIFPIWTYCDACMYLFNTYIPYTGTTSSPLKITGFDNQMMLAYSKKHLVHTLDSVLRAYDLPVTRLGNYTTEILPTLDSLKYFYGRQATNPLYYTTCDTYLQQMRTELKHVLDSTNFWCMLMDNMVAENKEFSLFHDDVTMGNVRDQAMASNLEWLATVKHPGEKIMVWAANEHVADYTETYTYKGVTWTPVAMGHYFMEDSTWRKKTYVLGFTSYTGKAGRIGWDTYRLLAPAPNGFENWVPRKYMYAFTDFNAYHPLTGAGPEYFRSKAFYHVYSKKLPWTNLFDGMFFIRQMYPCRDIYK